MERAIGLAISAVFASIASQGAQPLAHLDPQPSRTLIKKPLRRYEKPRFPPIQGAQAPSPPSLRTLSVHPHSHPTIPAHMYSRFDAHAFHMSRYAASRFFVNAAPSHSGEFRSCARRLVRSEPRRAGLFASSVAIRM